MRRCNSYYTLVASLPPLPRFDRAGRLPINRVRLLGRLGMLAPSDAEVVRHASALFDWDRAKTLPGDAEAVGHHRALERLCAGSALWEILAFPSDQKTLLAALRRRRLGRPRPAPGEPWGVGRWVGRIQRNWEEPDFGLAPLLPWLPQVRSLLENGQALALQRELFARVWDHLDRQIQGLEFRFENVLVYLFKWDMLERWLSHRPDEARARFEKQVTEALHGP